MSRDVAAKGDMREEERVHALLAKEKIRDRDRQLRNLRPRTKGTRVNQLRI